MPMNILVERRRSLMANTINEYFQPSSTSSHSNIDDLILQSELDKRQFGGASLYKGEREYPIDMVEYANLISKANMSSAISNSEVGRPLEAYITRGESRETLKDLSKEVVDRMRLGDSPMGIIAYNSPREPGFLGRYIPSKNPLYSPDTIRIFSDAWSYDTEASTLLHEPIHGIRMPHDNNANLFHSRNVGTKAKDFDIYEENMLQSLSDYFGGRKKAKKKLENLLDMRYDRPNVKAYRRRVAPYNPIEDILNR